VRDRRTSLRLRLTISYGVLFLGVGLAMVTLTYFLLLQRALINTDKLTTRVIESLGYSSSYMRQPMPTGGPSQETVGAFLERLTREGLERAPGFLSVTTFVALAVAAVISVALSWWMAGRMLRPISEISAVARQLSASTLHERIGLQGPQDELRDLADTFDAMLIRLEASFTAQREFVANASHELRTPLAIMRTELDVTLADPEVDLEELRQMATTIRSAIARSEDVIDRLLLLAESEDLAEREPVDLAEVVRTVAAQYDLAAEERGLMLRLDVTPAVAVGEATLLERLADNLISNAVSYAPGDSTVDVQLRHDDSWVVLTVANGGDVIDEVELPRLFERFYRRERSRSRRAGGSGLGLAIVAAIAEAHGGTAEAIAPSTGGLTVIVRLPSAHHGRSGHSIRGRAGAGS
jgi:signal transduction histidine kinase